MHQPLAARPGPDAGREMTRPTSAAALAVDRRSLLTAGATAFALSFLAFTGLLLSVLAT